MTLRLIIALLVALTQAANLFDITGMIAKDIPLNYTFAQAYNLQGMMSFTVTENSLDKPFSVCIVLEEFGLPHWTQYHEDNCLFFWTATGKVPFTQQFPLVDSEYTVGIYLADDTKNETSHVSISVTGDECATGTYFDDFSKTCVKAEQILSLNDTFAATFAQSETKIWTYTAVNRIGHFVLSFIEESPEDLVVVRARYNAAPLAAIHDYSDSNGELKAVSPLPGTWVFSVHSTNAQHIQFQFDGEVCPVDKAGDNCTTPVHTAFNNASYTIGPKQWIFLRFEVTATENLLFSATAENSTFTPTIYASRGQIPSLISSGTVLVGNAQYRVSADIKNCNREYCDEVRSIWYNYTQHGDEEWFIGIYSDRDVPVTFGFWFNSTCVPNCELDNHGQCEDSGKCICEIDFEGIDCGVSKGLGPQYIVLIIIASLVVASAIIGFVAWAYMRRKRADYEIVS